MPSAPGLHPSARPGVLSLRLRKRELPDYAVRAVCVQKLAEAVFRLGGPVVRRQLDERAVVDQNRLLVAHALLHHQIPHAWIYGSKAGLDCTQTPIVTFSDLSKP